MHLKKSKKIIFYFFILIGISSINNIQLKNLKFDKIKNIYVSGLSKKENYILIKKIKNLDLKNIFFINEKEIINLIDSNTLIEKYEITKKYPNTINVKIKKTNFLAKIHNNGETFLIGSNGKLTPDIYNNDNLPYIFGKPAIEEFLNFKKILDDSKFSYSEIEKLYFFPSKRWDLKLKNKILVKLSKNFTKNSLNNIFDFLENYNNDKISIIDTRVNNQIILNE